jgi:hypothetical protein
MLCFDIGYDRANFTKWSKIKPLVQADGVAVDSTDGLLANYTTTRPEHAGELSERYLPISHVDEHGSENESISALIGKG